VLDAVESEGLLQKATDLGALMMERLRDMARRFELIGDVRGRGAMAAIELVEDRSTKAPARAATTRLIEECYREGVVILKAGTYDNVIRLLPPLVIAPDLLNEGLDVLEKALASVQPS
ncbi:MAG TPA: 4-aminobutyrate--2-oxoglutarate transaminase, partial [Actinobacteria bacterium]|nr:4-aminobutyrate--2-oxoglutarate transaminase [Actinomycetota bacterium]